MITVARCDADANAIYGVSRGIFEELIVNTDKDAFILLWNPVGIYMYNHD